jgi:hypothetical protein
MHECDFNTRDFYTQSANSTRLQSVILHVECDYHKYDFNFNT